MLSKAQIEEMRQLSQAENLVWMGVGTRPRLLALLAHIETQEKLMDRLGEGLSHRLSHIYNAGCYDCQAAMEAHLDYAKWKEEQRDGR